MAKFLDIWLHWGFCFCFCFFLFFFFFCFVFLCVCVCMYVCLCVYVCMQCMCLCGVCMYVCVCMCACMCLCGVCMAVRGQLCRVSPSSLGPWGLIFGFQAWQQAHLSTKPLSPYLCIYSIPQSPFCVLIFQVFWNTVYHPLVYLSLVLFHFLYPG